MENLLIQIQVIVRLIGQINLNSPTYKRVQRRLKQHSQNKNSKSNNKNINTYSVHSNYDIGTLLHLFPGRDCSMPQTFLYLMYLWPEVGCNEGNSECFSDCFNAHILLLPRLIWFSSRSRPGNGHSIDNIPSSSLCGREEQKKGNFKIEKLIHFTDFLPWSKFEA